MLHDLLFAPTPVGGAGDSVVLTAPQAVDAERLGYEAAKRVFDVVLSSLIILCLTPVFVLTALAVKLTSRGPVLYRHLRVGKNGSLFTCLKFRTMVTDADKMKEAIAHLNVHDDDRTFKVHNDPRVTSIGGFLRRMSVDELPQLFNVLVGDMSLVGPRPPLPNEVALYSDYDRQRLLVKPGITCIWQVSGRSRLAFPEQVRLDIEYIEQRSLWLDAMLVFKTIPAVLGFDGAY